MEACNHSNELYHYGVLGMKWGIRRYQNEDGSLTLAGKRKYGTKTNFEKVQRAKKAASVSKEKAKKNKAREKANARTEAEIAKYEKKVVAKKDKTKVNEHPKAKSISDMTDDELRSKINRIQLENQYRSLNPEKVSFGKKMASKFLNEAIVPAATNAGRAYIEKVLKDALDVNAKEAISEYDKLKKEVDLKTLKKQNTELNKYFEKQKQSDKSKPSESTNDSDQKRNDSSSSNDAQQSTSDSKGTSRTETFTGEVRGEGSSRSSYNREETSNRTKSDNYYDSIDVDYRDITSGSTYEAGKRYVSNLLQLEEHKTKK